MSHQARLTHSQLILSSLAHSNHIKCWKVYIYSLHCFSMTQNLNTFSTNWTGILIVILGVFYFPLHFTSVDWMPVVFVFLTQQSPGFSAITLVLSTFPFWNCHFLTASTNNVDFRIHCRWINSLDVTHTHTNTHLYISLNICVCTTLTSLNFMKVVVSAQPSRIWCVLFLTNGPILTLRLWELHFQWISSENFCRLYWKRIRRH